MRALASRKRKYYKTRSAAKIALQVLLALVIVVVISAVALFFGLKKYIVTDENGLRLEVPFLTEQSAEAPPEMSELTEE